MKWNNLIKEEEKGVLLDTTGTTYLWTEKPKILEVEEIENPLNGYVWLIEDKNGGVKVYKANYDSSD